MSINLDRLYELLPTIYRVRDAEQGEPLRALLQVISEQADIVEKDINQLYENWFIETCEDWVVPYLGDLIGYQPVAEAGSPSDSATIQGRQRNKVLIPRHEIANTLRYRRRKGSLALLECLANDVADWKARAVEFYPLLASTQHLNYLRPDQGRTVDLRNSHALQHLGGAFDELAHSVDVRRINSNYVPGRYNLAAVGLFVWRLQVYSVNKSSPKSKTPACCIEEVAPHCYTFSALGNDTPLYNRPVPETDDTSLAGELNMPVPIRRRAFDDENIAEPVYYGEDNSFAIWAPGWPNKNSRQPVPRELITSTDLTDWRYQSPKGKLAVDPILGRMVFPAKQLPKKVWVSYYYGFSANIGGGEYTRVLAQPENSVLIQVCGQEQLQKALEPWQAGQPLSGQPPSAVIEIIDSGVYVLPINLELDAMHHLQIRAANERRPVIRLLDYKTDQPDSLSITGAAGSHLVLDGLLVEGRGVLVEGAVNSVLLRHTTLVPGWSLAPDCQPCRPAEPSLYVLNSQACIIIQHSIVGSIQVSNDEVGADPIIMRINDSVVDATGWECEGPECEAIGSPGSGFAHASVSIVRSTVLGSVETHAIMQAEDSIFMGKVCVARRQIGCMRFCYVPPESRTPRRFMCQPDGVSKNLTGEAKIREQLRVRPEFNSTRYGRPSYCQLAQNGAIEITHGAEDESEMGVFHDLYQPQRLANLQARLQQFTPAGTDVDIILAS
ncbi:MAG: hypothetical protein PSV18_06300 [Methylobacter sp.]|nr:hypothetical protein [Candidatus Methylobacter titanis]